MRDGIFILTMVTNHSIHLTPEQLTERALEYVITFCPDNNTLPHWMNMLGNWVDVDDVIFEEGEDVYNSWEEWIESPYFKLDGAPNTSSAKEGDWVKKSALHNLQHGKRYMEDYLRNGPMRVKRYREEDGSYYI